ncbi:unnamed protein product, partial [Staurois parvus]
MCLCIKMKLGEQSKLQEVKGGANAFWSMLNRLLLQTCRGTSWTLLPDPIDRVCCWMAGCSTWIH